MWEILSLTDMLVTFDLVSIEDALKAEFNLSGDTPPSEQFLQLLDKDKTFAGTLKSRLDDVWERYGLHGALLVFNWREELKQAVNARLLASKSAGTYLRAEDPLLVLNVLGRARTTLLLANAPLALDRPFLTRTLVCDDARVVRLTRQGVYKEESLIEPDIPDFEEEE